MDGEFWQLNKGFAARCEEKHREIWGGEENRGEEIDWQRETSLHRMLRICKLLGENQARKEYVKLWQRSS